MEIIVPTHVVDAYVEAKAKRDSGKTSVGGEAREKHVEGAVADRWRRICEAYERGGIRELEAARGRVEAQRVRHDRDRLDAERALASSATLRSLHDGWAREPSRSFAVVRARDVDEYGGRLSGVHRFNYAAASGLLNPADAPYVLAEEVGPGPGYYSEHADTAEGPVRLSDWVGARLGDLAGGLAVGPTAFDTAVAAVSGVAKAGRDRAEAHLAETEYVLALYDAAIDAASRDGEIGAAAVEAFALTERGADGARRAERARLLSSDGDFVLAAAGRMIQHDGVSAREAHRRLSDEVRGVDPDAELVYRSPKALTDAMRRREDGLGMTATEARDRGGDLAGRLSPEELRYL